MSLPGNPLNGPPSPSGKKSGVLAQAPTPQSPQPCCLTPLRHPWTHPLLGPSMSLLLLSFLSGTTTSPSIPGLPRSTQLMCQPLQAAFLGLIALGCTPPCTQSAWTHLVPTLTMATWHFCFRCTGHPSRSGTSSSLGQGSNPDSTTYWPSALGLYLFLACFPHL